MFVDGFFYVIGGYTDRGASDWSLRTIGRLDATTKVLRIQNSCISYTQCHLGGQFEHDGELLKN